MQTLPDPFVALFARYPTPGEVKTRLIPATGAEGAARLHRQLVERTLAIVEAAGLCCELWSTGADPDAFRQWLGPGLAVVEQGSGDLGVRMARAAERAPVILLGADLPDLAPEHLQAAIAAMRMAPVAVGPAEDGGYYLLALERSFPFLFTRMPWGTGEVLRLTEERLNERGLAYRLLERLADLDRPEDLKRWPWLSAC